MSAALQLPSIWATASVLHQLHIVANAEPPSEPEVEPAATDEAVEDVDTSPNITLAFYRKHPEKMLRRYLYASMLVGRAPSILGEPMARGFVSSRRVKTFEDAVIFVLDIERCLDKLSAVDRAILSRIVLQEFSFVETAAFLRISVRSMSYKYPQAIDRLTELLLHYGLLVVSSS
jgi:hypothetical protein